MGISIEFIDEKYRTAIIRAGANHNRLEDDFELTGTVLIDGESAILKGFAGVIPKYFRSDMKKLLGGLGIKNAIWQIDASEETANKYKGHDKA